MINKKRLAASLLIGMMVLAAGFLPLPYADLAFWPGSILASPFWPEGIHSGFSGTASIAAMFVVIWGGTLLSWSAITYLAASVISARRVEVL